jgi:hypothetical protein
MPTQSGGHGTPKGRIAHGSRSSRRRRIRRAVAICIFQFAICILQLFANHCSAADEAWSIPQLNEQKDRWSDLIDRTLKVEGRVSGVSKHQFRFVHCDLTFHVTEEQSRQAGLARNVEVSGRFRKEKSTGKLIFAVDRVRTLPSDVDQFDSRVTKLKSADSADWYALADWAESRGKFYDDEELAGRAQRARKTGIQSERQSLPEGDDESRLALAAKLHDWKLEPRLQEELIHEGARLKWEATRNNAAQQGKFQEWLEATYPDSAKPVPEISAELIEKYAAHPLETFAEADEPARKLLQRLFHVEVDVARLAGRAKPDASNADEIADRLAKAAPERQDLVQKYREAAVQRRLMHIGEASRQEALRLAEDLKSRDDAAAARELLRGWVESREPRLRKDGPLGLMQLAEDYLQLVEDEPAAVKLLAEAYRLDPSFSDSAERLKQLGYRLEVNRWVKSGGSDAAPADRSGHSELEIGMSAEQVLTLLGSPTAKGRIFSSKGMQEVWSFGRRGTPRLLIHLQRPAPGAAPKVIRFLSER